MNFDKELNKKKKEFSNFEERMAFLDGVEFMLSWDDDNLKKVKGGIKKK